MAVDGVGDRDSMDRRTMKGLVVWQRGRGQARRGPIGRRGETGEGGRRGASWGREERKDDVEGGGV
jgi:hypothetical protein